MRTTSQVWKDIVAKGEFNMESTARIYGATGSDPNGTAGSDSRGNYREYATITAPIITRALLSGDAVSVGNTIASQLNFSVMTTDIIPKSAMIVIRARVKDFTGTTFSEWLEFGTYWLDHRTVNDNITDIEAYDAMKKGNQVYSDTSQTLVWPKTIKVVVTRIAQQIGISIDSRTMSEIINSVIGDMEIVLKPNDDEVLLDVLRHIGEVLGGNWTITDDNELRFVGLVDTPNETYFIVDEAHNLIKTEQNDYLIYQGRSKEHEEQTHPSGGGTCFVPVVLGSLTTASKYTISKVTIAINADHVYTYGNDTGYHLIVSENNPYASEAMVRVLYNRVRGVEYSPFEITNAVYDPATELGDWVVAGSVYSVLYNDKRTLDVGFYADMTAPGRDEMEDEYPYQTFAQKTKFQIDSANKSIDEANATIDVLSSEISQMPDSILLSVSQVYETKTHSAENLQTAKSYADDVGADAIEQADDDTDTKLQSYYTKTETESKISTEIGKIDLSVYETKTQSKTYYDNAIDYADGIGTDANSYTDTQVSSAEGRIKITTDAIEASVSNKVGNNEIRSKFALDKTNITLSAGTDGSGNPTGTITFNAGTLAVNSTNFKLDSSGHLECTGAKIYSEGFVSSVASTVKQYINIEDGAISGGRVNDSESGYIYFGGHPLYAIKGIVIKDDVVSIWTNKLYVVSQSSPGVVSLVEGWNGYIEGRRVINGIIT